MHEHANTHTHHTTVPTPAPPRFRTLRFNTLASQASISLLLLSAISIVLPTAALRLGMGGSEEEHLSPDRRACAGVWPCHARL